MKVFCFENFSDENENFLKSCVVFGVRSFLTVRFTVGSGEIEWFFSSIESRFMS